MFFCLVSRRGVYGIEWTLNVFCLQRLPCCMNECDMRVTLQ